ncbi:MAG: nucleotide-diphospho-sugar transferase [Pyrinomonadaceae bacterium]|nr:nucleotide-diphospho-sugar transferase [Sphingobacteriaceae bacterium]
MNNSLQTPVLLLIFNRPQTTKKVFDAIRNVRPEKLYISADGPRSNVEHDQELCDQTRQIVSNIDWPCSVQTLFRDENMGVRYAVTTGIDWFFEHEEEGIILEDDCLPGIEFFNYCSELLNTYRNDVRVMHITGTNLQFGRKRGNASYYFSTIPCVWGWASWRRVWNLYDREMEKFPKFEEQNQIVNVFPDKKTADWVINMARLIYEKKVITWDYPLAFTICINNGLCIVPNENLVSNIGFGEGSTHTIDGSHAHSNIPVKELGTIEHPKFMIPDRQADLFELSLSINNVKSSEVNKEKEVPKLNILQKIKRRLLHA